MVGSWSGSSSPSVVGPSTGSSERRDQSAVSEETVPLAPMKSFSVYLIYKEAITNILKHAGARKIEVRMVEYAGKLLLTIRDDGRGFSLEEADENGNVQPTREDLGDKK